MGDTAIQAGELDRKLGYTKTALEEIEGRYDIELNFKMVGLSEIPDVKGFAEKGLPEGPGGQHGLDFVVPPGFPGDSFPFRATSGEHVQVTPKGQGSAGGVTQNITQIFNDEGAAALGMAVVRKFGRDRLNAGMGR
jgi:hypothetical protein